MKTGCLDQINQYFVLDVMLNILGLVLVLLLFAFEGVDLRAYNKAFADI